MTRKGDAITLSLLPHHKERLEQIAIDCGATWGEKPNISELNRMIADGRLILYKPGSPITTSDRTYYEEQVAGLKRTIANLEKL